MGRSDHRFKVIPAVYLLLRDGDKVLMMRRANTGYMDGKYGVPSGHLDGGESAMVAAAREALEEIGVTIDPADLTFAHVCHRLAEEEDYERVDFFFEVDAWQGKPKNAEPEKCDDLKWFDIKKLPENTIPVVRSVLMDITEGRPYSEHNFDRYETDLED